MHRFPVVCGIDNSSVEGRENEAIGHDGGRREKQEGGRENQRGGGKEEGRGKVRGGRERGNGSTNPPNQTWNSIFHNTQVQMDLHHANGLISYTDFQLFVELIIPVWKEIGERERKERGGKK